MENREQLKQQLETWRTRLEERGQSVRERIFVGPALRVLEQATKLLPKLDDEILKNTLAEFYRIQRLSLVDQSLGITPIGGGSKVEGRVHRRLLAILSLLLLAIQLAGCGESGAEVVGDTGDISDTGYEKNLVVMVTEQSPDITSSVAITDSLPPAGAIDGAEGIAPPEPPKTVIQQPEETATIDQIPTAVTMLEATDTAQAFLQTQFEANFPDGLPEDLKITEVTTNDQGQNVARNAEGEALAFEVNPGEWRQGALASWEVATAPENATVLLDIYRLKVTVDNDLAWKGKKPTLEVHDNVRLDAWRDAVLNNIPTQGLETGNTERADYGQTEFAPAAGQITNLEVHIFTFTDPTELPPGFVAEFADGNSGEQDLTGRLYQQDGDTMRIFVAINSKHLANADSYWAPRVIRGGVTDAEIATYSQQILNDFGYQIGLTVDISEIQSAGAPDAPRPIPEVIRAHWALLDVATAEDGSAILTDGKATLMGLGPALEVNWQ